MLVFVAESEKVSAAVVRVCLLILAQTSIIKKKKIILKYNVF